MRHYENKSKLVVKLPLIVIIFSLLLFNGCSQNSINESVEGKTEKEEVVAEKTEPEELSNEETTAREAFGIAEKEAMKWSSDAVLVDLTNFRGTSLSDGESIRWSFDFNSADLGKRLEVTVNKSKIFQTMEGKYRESDILEGDWIDTPEAIETAKPYFQGEAIKNYWYGLGEKDEMLVWYVKCDYEEEVPTWVEINALSGEFLETREGN